LQTRRKCEVALHGGGDGQRVAKKLQHGLPRSRLPFVVATSVHDDAATSGPDSPAHEEIHAWEAAVGDVRRNYVVVTRREHGGN
jgi:hypothetical protein